MGSCMSKQDDRGNQASASSGTGGSTTFCAFELSAACNNFSDSCLLGTGRFGPVYKGTLSRTGQVVAIKKLRHNVDGLDGVKAFDAEARMLIELDHPNLVSTIGYCVDPIKRFLAFEYMPLGSLEDHLFRPNSERRPLNWNTRMRIALCVARGLEYLHCKRGEPLIYRDLKCSNILLRQGHHAKLSVFALADEGPVTSEPNGRMKVVGCGGYVAPEYRTTHILNVKFDIYGFGAVLFEIITGRSFGEYFNGEDSSSALLNIADPLLKKFPRDEYSKAAALTERCLQADPDRRPVIGEIVHELSVTFQMHQHVM